MDFACVQIECPYSQEGRQRKSDLTEQISVTTFCDSEKNRLQNHFREQTPALYLDTNVSFGLMLFVVCLSVKLVQRIHLQTPVEKCLNFTTGVEKLRQEMYGVPKLSSVNRRSKCLVLCLLLM